MKSLNVGLIGLGAMGRNHARVLHELEGVNLFAVHDDDKSKGIDFSEKFKNSISEFYECELDYVVIATPTSTHLDHAFVAIENGIDFLIEKPLSLSSEVSRRILAYANEKGVTGGVGHIERFNSAMREAKRLISSGSLGEIIQINFQRQGPKPDRIKDVGVLLDLASHDFDSLLFLEMGTPRTLFATSTSLSQNHMEDSVEVLGKLDSQVSFSMSVNWISARKKRLCTVTTTRGILEIDTLGSNLIFYENGNLKNTQREILHFQGNTTGPVQTYSFEKREALIVEHESFRDTILGRDSSIVKLEDGLNTVLLVEAANRSSQTGEVMNL
jgi:UDP-N-acetylglucosamine 3-dehydrogenase